MGVNICTVCGATRTNRAPHDMRAICSPRCMTAIMSEATPDYDALRRECQVLKERLVEAEERLFAEMVRMLNSGEAIIEDGALVILAERKEVA